MISVTNFGAVGNGSHDDTAAIQAALNTGGRIYFPGRNAPGMSSDFTGQYLIKAPSTTTTSILTATQQVYLLGDGEPSQIVVDDLNSPVLSSTTNILTFAPTAFANYGWGIEGLTFTTLGSHPLAPLDHSPPLPGPGQHVLAIQLPAAGAYIEHLTLRDNNFGNFGGSAVALNNQNGGPDTGLFMCLWQNNQFANGLFLGLIGDSVSIVNNLIPGNRLGIYASHTPGASNLTIADNNITTRGGGILLANSENVKVLRNQIEMVYPFNPGVGATTIYNGHAALVALDGTGTGSNQPCVLPEVRGNNVNTKGNASAGIILDCVRLLYVQNVVVDANTLNAGPGSPGSVQLFRPMVGEIGTTVIGPSNILTAT